MKVGRAGGLRLCVCEPRTFGVTQAHGEGGDVLRGASVWAGGTRQAVLNAGGWFHRARAVGEAW